METLLKISAHDNAAIKQYRKLARSRKERTKAGLFVLEGFRLVSDAVKNGAALTQLFWTEDGLARWQAEGLPTAWDVVHSSRTVWRRNSLRRNIHRVCMPFVRCPSRRHFPH